jgi:hypothetical protein
MTRLLELVRALPNPPLQRSIDSLASLGRALAAERMCRWADGTFDKEK